MEELEIQPLAPMSLEEMKEATVGMALGNMLTPIFYLGEKFGEEEVKAYLERAAGEQAKALREMGIDNPLDLLMLTARQEKYLFGSELEVRGDEEKAVLTFKRDRLLEVALAYAQETGREVSREWFLRLKNDKIHRRVVENLGLRFKWEELPDGGYRMGVSRK